MATLATLRFSEASLASREALANEWFTHLYGHGRSLSTLRTYRAALLDLWGFLDRMGMPAVEHLTAEHLRAWLADLRDRGAADWTIQTYQSAARSWWRFLVDEGEVPADPWLRIRRGKVPAPLMRPLTPDQVQQLVDVFRLEARRTRAWMALRNLALIGVLFDTGLRAAEVLSLRRADVDRDAVVIRGKGRKDRLFRLSPNVMVAVRRYVRAYERAFAPLTGDALLWRRGTEPLRYQGLYEMVRTAGSACGLDIHPHILRHSFATQFMEEGGDQYSLQLLLGHSSGQMTARYTASRAMERALRAHEEHAPGQRLKL